MQKDKFCERIGQIEREAIKKKEEQIISQHQEEIKEKERLIKEITTLGLRTTPIEAK